MIWKPVILLDYGRNASKDCKAKQQVTACVPQQFVLIPASRLRLAARNFLHRFVLYLIAKRGCERHCVSKVRIGLEAIAICSHPWQSPSTFRTHLHPAWLRSCPCAATRICKDQKNYRLILKKEEIEAMRLVPLAVEG